MIEALSNEILRIPWVREVKNTYETAIAAEEDASFLIKEPWYHYRSQIVRSKFSRLMSRLRPYLPPVIPANPKPFFRYDIAPITSTYYIPSTNDFFVYQKEQIDVLGRVIPLDEGGQYDPESPNFIGIDSLHQADNPRAVQLRPVNPTEGFANTQEEWSLDNDIYNAVREVEKILRAKRRGQLSDEEEPHPYSPNPYFRFDRLVERGLINSREEIEKAVEEERERQSLRLSDGVTHLASTLLKMPLTRLFAPRKVGAGKAEGRDSYYIYLTNEKRLVVEQLRDYFRSEDLFNMGIGDIDLIDEVKPSKWFRVRHNHLPEISPSVYNPRFYQPLLDSLVNSMLPWPLNVVVSKDAKEIRRKKY